MKLLKLLRLDFLPKSVDLGLLALRVWVGLSMLLLHGWDKLSNFGEKSEKFFDFLGLGPKISLSMAIMGEFGGSILLILGLFTRLGALLGAVTMSVAFFMVHQAALSGPKSGEMAFMYLAAYVALLIAGGGRFSFDAATGGKA